VACGAHKSNFLCQEPGFVCLSNRPSFFLKYIVFLGYGTADGVCDATVEEEQMAVQHNIVGQLSRVNF
jgi:hypothetical protein